MKLAVGDIVVYGAHGAGRVAARETKDGEFVVVVDLSRGLSVQLPLARAEELLRPVADEAEIGRVQSTLAAPARASDESWLRRRRDAQGKLGDPVGLAEILRDGASRMTGRARLSPSERELFRRAHELLATEIALSRGVEPAEAADWIDEQLSAYASSRFTR